MNTTENVDAKKCALAVEMFDHFCTAGTLKMIVGLHREICHCLNLKPNRFLDFYPKLKTKLAKSWKAAALFKKFDLRANHKVYAKGRACSQNKVLIIGAGPCGLRTAIECQLLGAKVVIVEKRDRLSRNNVVHLWPFVIEDLRSLGAKKFFGQFCAGSIDHISIRQLQCILLKVALLLGVEFHEGISFEELLEPTITSDSEVLGWRARVTPETHPVAEYEFDVLIGADGKRNTLQHFKRNEFRGKLALAITANFINRRTEQEASVPEISGVAFIFNQKFFNDLNERTGINLENIVYYKDDTHYFVMTAKKQSLLNKGVLLNDYPDVSKLLSVENVNRDALMDYAKEAAHFSTNGKLPVLDFALNHYGGPDVALFDFTSMFAAENASMVFERHGCRLLCQLVGDSLLEPFWPTGSGCARGFLSSLDACWAVRSFGQTPSPHPLEVIAERESIYRLLGQTTPENLNRDFGAYTLDPGTRYPNLNRSIVTPQRVTSYYISDDPVPLGENSTTRKRRREPDVSDEVLLAFVGCPESGLRAATSSASLATLLTRYRPDLLPRTASHRLVYKILSNEFGIAPISSKVSSQRSVPEEQLRSYLNNVYNIFKGEIPHVHHKSNLFEQIKQNQLREQSLRHATDQTLSTYSNAAHSSLRKKRRSNEHNEEGRVVGSGSRTPGKGDRIAQLATELCDTSTVSNHPRPSKPKDLMRAVGRIEPGDWNVKEIEKRILENRLGRPEPKVAERVPKWDRVEFLERQKRLQESGSNFEKAKDVDETLNKLNERRDSRPALGTNRVANLANEFAKKYQSDSEKNERSELYTPKKTWRGPSSTGMTCASCSRRVFAAEAVKADGLHLHRSCFRCAVCKATLRPGNYTMERNGMRLVCLRHGGMSVPDTVVVTTTTAKSPQNVPMPMPERISLGLSDAGAKEIDEDEWTDRNFLMSETSAAGGRSDEDDSSSDDYADAAEEENPDNDDYGPICGVTLTRPKYNKDSDDSFGYDDCSDDAVESSGSCSRMRAAREARRMEVPADQRPPIDSSEVESDDESESSEDEVSSATEVSTDSEFGREETAIQPSLPAILVTEPTTPRPQPQDCPLSRTRSAGGLATKRALELKRRYLLGESSPLAVRKSDSTSQLDTKIEAFRTNITEFQKMLHPAPVPAALNVAFQLSNVEKAKPMPDIIKKICDEAPVDLLDSPLSRNGKRAETSEEIESDKPLDSDSLSDDSHTQTVPNQSVPRLEVHNEGGELIDYNITLVTDDTDDKGSGTLTGATVLAAESESSESCRDGTTLALTETELSDWAAESGVLDECSLEYKEDRRRCKNPRTLSNPKLIHDAKNVTALSSHVCGRTSPEKFSNALEHFEFADEGDQDPSVEKAGNLSNEGFMEVVHDFDHDSSRILKNDNELSKKLIDSFSEMIIRPNLNVRYAIRRPEYSNSIDHNCTENTVQQTFNSVDQSTDSVSNHSNNNSPIKYENQTNSITERELNGTDHTESLNSDISPPLVHSKIEDLIETSKDIEIHNSNNCEKTVSPSRINVTNEFSSKTYPFRVLSPTLGQTSETFHRLNSSYSTGSPNIEQLASDETASTGKFNTLDNVMSPSTVVISSKTSSTDIPVSPSNLRTLSPGAYSLVSSVIDNYSESSPSPQQNKVLEINRERQKQTEVVRGLVLERLGNGPRLNRRSSKRPRMTVVSSVPPPVPPPPTFQITPPQTPPLQDSFSPPRPAPPVMPLPVTPSLSDPELTRERRNKSILNSITKCLNRRFGPRDKWASEPDLLLHINPPLQRMLSPTKSTGALEELAPPVPPPPVQYQPMPEVSPVIPITGYKRDPARDALIVLNLANEYAEQKVKLREETDATASRLSMLEKSLRRNMTAEQQAKAVAELLQVSAQRDAHAALQAADKKRKNPDNPDH